MEKRAEGAVPDLRRSVQRVGRRLRLERPSDGLPVTALLILAQLYDRGPLTSGSLARTLRTTPQALTRSIEDLTRRELLTRQRGALDARQHVLTISRAGRQELGRDAAPRDAWLARAMDELLTPAERDLLGIAAGLLDRLARYEPAAASDRDAGRS